MRRWHFGLAGAAALVLSALPVIAQTPNPPEGAPAFVAIDPRIGPDAATAVAAALSGGNTAPHHYALFPGQCGMPVEGRAELAEPDAGAGRFDPDSAMRAAAAADAGSLLLVASGPSECLSVACTLSASWGTAGRPLRIDVLALGPEAEPLRCLAENTGGQWKLVTPETAPEAAAAMLPPPAAGHSSSSAEEELPASRPSDQKADGAAGAETGTAAGGPERPGPSGPAQKPPEASSPPAQETPTWDGYPPLPKPRPGDRAAAEDGKPAAEATAETAPATGDSAAVPFKWAIPPPAAPEGAPPPPTDEPGIQMLVLAGPSGPLVETDLAFEILASAGDGTFRQVAESRDIRPAFSLAEGNYIARIAHGFVVREFPFTVSGKGIDHAVFSLDIGHVTLSVRPTANAAPLESGIAYTVTRLDPAGAGTPAMVVREAQPTIALPAGEYRITGQSEKIRSSRNVTVKAGDTLKQDFNLRIGYLRLAAPPDVPDVTLQVETLSSAGPGSSDVVASATGDTALFRLQEGNYIAVATGSQGERVEMIATIKQGKLIELRLPLSQKPQTHWWVQPTEAAPAN